MVTEIAKGVLGGSWNLIFGWILPSSLGLLVFGLTVVPSLTNLAMFATVSKSSASDQGVLLLIVSVIVGLTLASLTTPLYRVLEGYLLWPSTWMAKRTAKHVQSRRDAATLVRAAKGPEGHLDLRGALALERFRRYPDKEAQVAPTQLGNAIRRFEYYAYDRYQLSSQLLWNQLRGASGEALVKDVDNARAGVDFFVCLVYVSGGVSFSALLALLSSERQMATLLLVATISAATMIVWYRLAVVATDAWASAVRAMVDMGRVPLAKGLGLELPKTLAEEREMWQQVGWFLGYRFKGISVANLDSYRAPQDDEGADAAN